MGEQPRWQRRKADRPSEILAAALDCFVERGFSATRLEDIAARAGVKKGTLYLYFPNKEELFKALVRRELVPNIERLEAAASTTATASDTLRQFITMFAGTVAHSRIAVLPKLMIAESGNFPDLAKFYLDEVVHRVLRMLRAVLRRGVESGEFRPVDVDNTVYCVVGPILLMLLWRYSFGPLDDRPLDMEAVCQAHLDVLMNGLTR